LYAAHGMTNKNGTRMTQKNKMKKIFKTIDNLNPKGNFFTTPHEGLDRHRHIEV
jgi:hypothetical protein